MFRPIRAAVKASACKRAILVGHNAFFDLGIHQCGGRTHGLQAQPFHPFSTFDTVTLAGLAYGQTVLARTVIAAGMEWDAAEGIPRCTIRKRPPNFSAGSSTAGMPLSTTDNPGTISPPATEAFAEVFLEVLQQLLPCPPSRDRIASTLVASNRNASSSEWPP